MPSLTPQHSKSISTNSWGPKPFKKHHILYWVFRLTFHTWFIRCPLDISIAFERTVHIMTISSTFKFPNTSPYAWKYHRIGSTELIPNKANLRDLIAATGLVISNWIQIVDFSARVTVKFDGRPRKTIARYLHFGFWRYNLDPVGI